MDLIGGAYLLSMEPLTAVTVLAAQYGVQQLVRAIGGDPGLADLATQLVSALSASEDRLGQRLAGIESRLDEVLEQRYTVATDTGLRTLLDAGTAASPAVRTDEMVRARDLFREAAAAARTTLQVALAERYLMLCAFALDREDAARTALARINIAAFETALDSSDTLQTSLTKAEERVDREGGNRWQRARRVRETQIAIRAAAVEAADLAVQLLREARVLAERLGQTMPPLSQLAQRTPMAPMGVWNVGVLGMTSVRFGPLRIQWHRVERAEVAADEVFRVDVEVRSDPGMTRPVRLSLASPPSWRMAPLWGKAPLWQLPAQWGNVERYRIYETLPPEARSVHVRRQSVPSKPARPAPPFTARLLIGGVFAVSSPTAK